MIDDVISFRDKIHKGDFRIVLTPKHWKVLYVPEEESKANNLVTVVRNGVLRGYAAYCLTMFDGATAIEIRDICTDGKNIFGELIDKVIEESVRKNVDFVFVRKCREPYDNAFDEKGFLSFVESVIMVVLLDPKKLLLLLSQKVTHGKTLKLSIEGFDPIEVKVGREGIEVVKDEKPDVMVVTDDKTFIRLFFGKTSLLRELVKGKIVINNLLNLSTASRFFKIINQQKWYIPSGDWV